MKLSIEKKIALFVSMVALCVGLFVGTGISVVATELLRKSETYRLHGEERIALDTAGSTWTIGAFNAAPEQGGSVVRPYPPIPAPPSGSSLHSVINPIISLGGLRDLSAEKFSLYLGINSDRLSAYLDRLHVSAALLIGLAGILSALFAITGSRWLTSNHGSGHWNPTSGPQEDIPSGASQQSFVGQSCKIDGHIPAGSLLERLWHLTPDPVIVFNGEYGVEILNRRAEQLFGWTSDEARGMDVRTLLMPAKPFSRDKWLEYLHHPIDKGGELEIIGVQRNGLQIPLGITIEAVEYSGWRGFTLVARDTSAQKQREARLQALLDTDALTGVTSRRRYLHDSQKEFRAAKRYAKPLSVLVFDIDRFKAINDRFGHAMGDRVLMDVAEACRRMLRTPDTLGRLGGDEFAVTLPETDQSGALEVADRVRGAIRQLRFSDADGTEFTGVTVSIGIASMDKRNRHFNNLLHCGDSFLCIAKRNGRDRIAPEGLPGKIMLAGSATQ